MRTTVATVLCCCGALTVASSSRAAKPVGVTAQVAAGNKAGPGRPGKPTIHFLGKPGLSHPPLDSRGKPGDTRVAINGLYRTKYYSAIYNNRVDLFVSASDARLLKRIARQQAQGSTAERLEVSVSHRREPTQKVRSAIGELVTKPFNPDHLTVELKAYQAGMQTPRTWTAVVQTRNVVGVVGDSPILAPGLK